MDSEALEMRRDTTPPELWRMIIGHLPRDTAQKCLSVSRMFHAFAAPILFSTLRLRFGSWQIEYGYAVIAPEEDSGCKSCCILLRIITDPIFASWIKHLQIIASPGYDATFELCSWFFPCCMRTLTFICATGCVTRAVGCLSNLRSLEWHSKQDMLPTDELLGNLASCHALERIILP